MLSTIGPSQFMTAQSRRSTVCSFPHGYGWWRRHLPGFNSTDDAAFAGRPRLHLGAVDAVALQHSDRRLRHAMRQQVLARPWAIGQERARTLGVGIDVVTCHDSPGGA